MHVQSYSVDQSQQEPVAQEPCEPALVAECVDAMSSNSDGAPITVKHRIGVDDVAGTGADYALVHVIGYTTLDIDPSFLELLKFHHHDVAGTGADHALVHVIVCTPL